MAMKTVKTIRKTKKCMTRIQCAFRQWRARRRTRKARLDYFSARSIQCCIRRAYSKCILVELRRIKTLLLDECAATIQRVAKVQVSHALIKLQRKHLKEHEIVHPTVEECLDSMEDWIGRYGYDPVYGTKRIRRICLKIFARCLSVRGNTVVTRFGEAGVEQFPAPFLEERDGYDFATVRLYAHKKLSLPREERLKITEFAPKYLTSVKLDDISIRETVDLRVIALQCFFRIKISGRICGDRRKARNAAVFVQRKYRWRFSKKEGLAMMVQCLYRIHVAYLELKFKKLEVIQARKIQGGYRIHLGKLQLEERRRISTCQVLDSSGDLNELFDATKTLDIKGGDKSFWVSPVPTSNASINSQWISYDLLSKIPIGKIKLWCPNNTSSPKEVLVECANRVAGPWSVIETLNVAQKKDWQTFLLPKTVCRFFRLSFKKNWGNALAVSVCGVGFFVAKEITAHVVDQPTSLKVDPGPPVGKVGGEIVLSCKAAGWPPPTYQWTKNGKAMEGEIMPSLCIVIASSKSKEFKRFRCIHCKKINTELPLNIYRVICSNCKYTFDFPEVEEAADVRRPLELEIEELGSKVKQLKARKQDCVDDIKAHENKRKMREYARSKGEKMVEESEVVDGNDGGFDGGGGSLEKMLNSLDGEGVDGDGSLEVGGSIDFENGGNLKNGVLVKVTAKQKYKNMMKSFAEVDMESIADDESSMASSVKKGSVVLGLGNGSVAGGAEGSQMGSQVNGDGIGMGIGEDLDNDQLDENSVGTLEIVDEEKAENEEVDRQIAELNEEIEKIDVKLQACEKKNWWLMRKRLEAGDFDPCKVKYEGEGVYVCVVSNVRGGENMPQQKNSIILNKTKTKQYWSNPIQFNPILRNNHQVQQNSASRAVRGRPSPPGDQSSRGVPFENPPPKAKLAQVLVHARVVRRWQRRWRRGRALPHRGRLRRPVHRRKVVELVGRHCRGR